MQFPVWIARSQTADDEAQAIRRLQRRAPAQVREHFRIDEGGSFDLQVAAFEVRAG